MRKIGLLFGFCLLATTLFGQEPRLVLPIGHTDEVLSAKFSPDERRVVTCSVDGTAKIWDERSETMLFDLRGHTALVSSAEFSPDGKWIVTGSNDNTAKIWDAQTGKMLVDLKGHSSGVMSAKFSPDGKKIVTASMDSTAIVWDARNGAMLVELKEHTHVVNSAEFSPDGRTILTASDDHTAKVWDMQTGTMIFDLNAHTASVNSAKFSPDGKKIVTASTDHTAKIWDAKTGTILFTLSDNELVQSAVFSHDGERVVTEPLSGTEKIWDAQNGKLLIELKVPGGYISKVEFSPDDKKIFAALEDGTANILDAHNGSILVRFKGHSDWINSAEFSSDGKKVLTASNDRSAKIWDVQTGKMLADLKGHASSTSMAEFSPDSKSIVTASSDKIARIWDWQTGTMLVELKGHSSIVKTAKFFPDEKKILTTADDGTAKIWDARTGSMLVDFKALPDEGIHTAEFSIDGKKLVTTTADDGFAKIWDTRTGAMLVKLNEHSENASSAKFSPDGKKIVTRTAYGETAKIWDAQNGSMLVELKVLRSSGKLRESRLDVQTGKMRVVSQETFVSIYVAEFSPDGQKILTASTDPIAEVWDAQTGKLLIELQGHTGSIYAAEFSPDGKKIVTASNDCMAKIWDAQTGKLLVSLKGNTDGVERARFSPDGKKILTASRNNIAMIWDAQTGAMLGQLNGNTVVNSIEFSRDSKKVVATSIDATTRISDAQTGKLINTFFAVDSTDYFNQIPTGYYFCTQNAAKLLHYVTKNLEVITFDQLDIKYNRPDKVLEAIGCPDTALIHAYRRAYEKRIKKLGIDTTSFKSGYSVPKADLLNRDQIEQQPEQKKDQLSLHIAGSDSTYNLDRFNVWVNQVPVYGIRGISLKNRNKNTLDTAVTITLSQGDNRIETSVTDANGTESYHIPLYVKYTPDKPVDTLLHFVGIGINKFGDKNYNLSWSVKDIRDLALKFKEKYGSKCTIDTLFDENVTTAKVVVLKDALLKSGVNDKVVLAYSGHGLLSKDYDYFLSTYDVNFKDPAQNGLPYDALESLLDSIPARKKLMLIDACHSGEVDKEEMARYLQTANERKKNGLKGAEIEFTQKSGMSMASSFELMKQLFVNVGKSTGATIISAAGGVQYALEKNDLQNGVFTYSILENMQKNPHVNISALKQYVNKRVTELTAGMQVPTTRNETDVVDWEVW